MQMENRTQLLDIFNLSNFSEYVSLTIEDLDWNIMLHRRDKMWLLNKVADKDLNVIHRYGTCFGNGAFIIIEKYIIPTF